MTKEKKKSMTVATIMNGRQYVVEHFVEGDYSCPMKEEEALEYLRRLDIKMSMPNRILEMKSSIHKSPGCDNQVILLSSNLIIFGQYSPDEKRLRLWKSAFEVYFPLRTK